MRERETKRSERQGRAVSGEHPTVLEMEELYFYNSNWGAKMEESKELLVRKGFSDSPDPVRAAQELCEMNRAAGNL